MNSSKRKSQGALCEGNSTVECQLPKLNVAGSIPVPRSKIFLRIDVFLVFVSCVLLFFISGCATTEYIPTKGGPLPTKGIYHKVLPGETLWRIAKMYHVSMEELISSNRIPNVAHIEKNQLIFIPGVAAKKDIVIEKFIKWCNKGPITARVDHVEITELPSDEPLTTFEIK